MNLHYSLHKALYDSLPMIHRRLAFASEQLQINFDRPPCLRFARSILRFGSRNLFSSINLFSALAAKNQNYIASCLW